MSFAEVAQDAERLAVRCVQQSTEQADRIVQRFALQVLADIVETWPVDTGNSRAAWAGPQRDGPAAYSVSNPVVYASVIEYGRYPGVGPRTAAYGPESLPGGTMSNAGIYPTQSPVAPARRALGEAKEALTAALGEGIRQSFHP